MSARSKRWTYLICEPDGKPKISSIKELLATPCVCALMRVAEGGVHNFNQEMALAYLESGAYLLIEFESLDDLKLLQWSAGVALGSVQ